MGEDPRTWAAVAAECPPHATAVCLPEPGQDGVGTLGEAVSLQPEPALPVTSVAALGWAAAPLQAAPERPESSRACAGAGVGVCCGSRGASLRPQGGPGPLSLRKNIGLELGYPGWEAQTLHCWKLGYLYKVCGFIRLS